MDCSIKILYFSFDLEFRFTRNYETGKITRNPTWECMLGQERPLGFSPPVFLHWPQEYESARPFQTFKEVERSNISVDRRSTEKVELYGIQFDLFRIQCMLHTVCISSPRPSARRTQNRFPSRL